MSESVELANSGETWGAQTTWPATLLAMLKRAHVPTPALAIAVGQGFHVPSPTAAGLGAPR